MKLSLGRNPKQGDMRIWWVPQVPMDPFHVYVKDPLEAFEVMAMLAQYDIFQYENRIKPDFANAGGLEIFDLDYTIPKDSDYWVTWYSSDPDVAYDMLDVDEFVRNYGFDEFATWVTKEYRNND